MNILKRISMSYAALIALMAAVAVLCFLSLVYMSNRLESQRAKQVQLATLTERVKGGFYAEIDSARIILLERAYNSPTHTDPAAIAASVDVSEAALQRILPDAASRARFKPFADASVSFDQAHEQVVKLANEGQFRQAAAVASDQLAMAGTRLQAALSGLGQAIDESMAAEQKNLNSLRTTTGIVDGVVAAIAIVVAFFMALSQRRSFGKHLCYVVNRLG